MQFNEKKITEAKYERKRFGIASSVKKKNMIAFILVYGKCYQRYIRYIASVILDILPGLKNNMVNKLFKSCRDVRINDYMSQRRKGVYVLY